ncbi:MAG TPA: hypothetical protein VEU31_07330 [Candidatus Acidoferrales bacterium]|nr:hypothetical protein [Candidatus Acidoferrales bacterium]
MTRPSHLPGYDSLHFLRTEWMRLGVYTGICCSLVLIAWLLVANRMPALERFALERNIAAAGAIALLMIIPALRFARSPSRMLMAGVTGWAFFSLVYRMTELFFSRLETRMGAFHVFVLGAVVYAVVAAITWIAWLVLAARKHPLRTPHHRTR